MHLMLPSRALSCVVVAALVYVACGGKTADLDASAPPEGGAPETSTPEASPPVQIDAGGRTCPPECLVGHQCCIGGCGGLPANMPSSCCSCLPGETDSMQCTNGKCGG
jgi:hypothetical protein